MQQSVVPLALVSSSSSSSSAGVNVPRLAQDVDHLQLLTVADRALVHPVLVFMHEELAPELLSVAYADHTHAEVHVRAHRTKKPIYVSMFAEIERLSEWIHNIYINPVEEQLVVVMSAEHQRRQSHDVPRVQANLPDQERALAALAHVALEESSNSSNTSK